MRKVEEELKASAFAQLLARGIDTKDPSTGFTGGAMEDGSAGATVVEAEATAEVMKTTAKTKATKMAEMPKTTKVAAVKMPRPITSPMKRKTKRKPEDQAKSQDAGPKAKPAGTKEETGGGELFAVEKILKKRKRKSKTEYLVSWSGYGEADNTWEVKGNVCDCQAFQEFLQEEEEVASTKGKKKRRRT